MSDWIEPGSPAPDFALPSDEGREVRLHDLRGRPVVLYFYPKDDTPGCTREACAFRDRQSDWATWGAAVLGVSTDSLASHQKFRGKYKLNFPLLADTAHRVAEAYGAWREKNLYGKRSLGIQRSTYLIDAAGRVAHVWKKVQVDGHDAEVLAALRELGTAAAAPPAPTTNARQRPAGKRVASAPRAPGQERARAPSQSRPSEPSASASSRCEKQGVHDGRPKTAVPKKTGGSASRFTTDRETQSRRSKTGRADIVRSRFGQRQTGQRQTDGSQTGQSQTGPRQTRRS